MKRIDWYFSHPIATAFLIDSKIFKKFFSRSFSRNMLPRDKKCTFCGREFHNYLPHVKNIPIRFKKYDVALGTRLCYCPYCGTSDKYRWLWYVLEHYTDISTRKEGSVLHFAPESVIRDCIKRNTRLVYTSGDIQPGRADLVIDMTNIQFEDGSFDYVIAGMVLEHIPDEKKALSELMRVLKPDGKVVLTIPVAYNLEKTLEDPSVNTDTLRNEIYGQENHVRLYGKDFKARFEKVGLTVKEYVAREMLDEKEVRRFGFLKNMPVLICEKKNLQTQSQ